MRSTITKILIFAGLLIILAWPIALHAQTTPVDMSVASGGEIPMLSSAWDAVTRGDYAPAAVILLIAAVWFIRMDHTRIPVVGALIDKTFGRLVRWSRSDRGGVFAVFITSILGGVLHTLMAHQHLSGQTLKMALGLGIAAIGGWTGVKHLFFPPDKKVTTGTIEDTTTPPPPPAA
jgi:hypothetical protein